jgi:glycosyltransferase involved in cell wall biosynthesis
MRGDKHPRRNSSDVKRLRVLHIANWYPNCENPREALFVKEQINCLREYTENRVVHVQVVSDVSSWQYLGGTYPDGTDFLKLKTPLSQGRLVELLTALLLLVARLRLGRRKWDVVNIHIAYPLLRFGGWFKLLFGRKIALTEHWSAYHKDFNLPYSSKARQRLASMFSETLPIATVSRALGEDIRRFAGLRQLNLSIVPNVVDPEVFHRPDGATVRHQGRLLMVANWAPIKRPFLVLEAFRQLADDFPEAELHIVGYGAQWQAMCEYVNRSCIAHRITFLGPRSKSEIAEEMRLASGFLHPSDYETFSVVCAEALSCGCPVIASNVGGIPEVVGEAGVLVENTLAAWVTALSLVLGSQLNQSVAMTSGTERFAPSVVGQAYRDFLETAA